MCCHKIAGLRGSRCFNHHADGNFRIISDALPLEFFLYVRNDVTRGAEIIDGGDEWKQYARSSKSGGPVERSQLCSKDVLVFKTETKTANPEVGIDAVPTLLIDAHV